MKIAVRGGHNFSVPGARGIIDETTEDRKIKDSLIKYLRLLGHNVLDVTPPDSYNNVSSDLVYGVNKATSFGADLFISCHFNNAYRNYTGSIGSEVIVYKNSFTEANAAMSALASLGFKNRGVKADPGLYELRATSMPSMILEICFVEATDDVALYRRLGFDTISKTIAEYICGKKVPVITPTPSKPSTGSNSNNPLKELWQLSISGDLVKSLQRELNSQVNANLTVDGLFGQSTLNKCITVKEGSKGGITKILQSRLISLGYSVGSYGADGSFGSSTKAAIIKFQKSRKLTADGIVGKNTWKELFKK
ncbi:peptidoglycan-binding protein [Clostridium sp.]|uniref:peptidoglycan-binding protein n=1 Tax=Clostridium sp. TaxID=1506 RepID=UPI002FCB4083